MLVVDAINAEDMPDKIFVNQRIRNFAKGDFEDTFVAVCTPTQLEDFLEDSPGEGTSYYRTNSIRLIARTAEELRAVFESLVYEVKKLVVDLTDLDSLSEAEVYTISALDPVSILSTAPQVTDVVGGTTTIRAYFSPPSNNGGSNIVYYEYSLDGGTTWSATVPQLPISPLILDSVPTNSRFFFTMRAVNASGNGASSSIREVRTYTAQASPPVINNVTADTSSLTVDFAPPLYFGDAGVSNYEYSFDGGITWEARIPASAMSPIVIDGLEGNRAYNIRLRAISGGQAGTASDAAWGVTVN